MSTKGLTRTLETNTEWYNVQVECPECKGTGLYVGYMEQATPGEAVICSFCRGKGWVLKSIAKFTGRKKMPRINSVKVLSPGHYTFGGTPAKILISYDQFEKEYPVNLSDINE